MIMSDLQEVKSDIKELLQRSAVHNELLRTHEARSIALQQGQEKLEARLSPVEEHVSLVGRILKGAGLILVGTVIQAVVRFWL